MQPLEEIQTHLGMSVEMDEATKVDETVYYANAFSEEQRQILERMKR